jgi:hypothetical protein
MFGLQPTHLTIILIVGAMLFVSFAAIVGAVVVGGLILRKIR